MTVVNGNFGDEMELRMIAREMAKESGLSQSEFEALALDTGLEGSREMQEVSPFDAVANFKLK